MAGNDDAHDLVGAFQDLVDAEVAHNTFDTVVVEICSASFATFEPVSVTKRLAMAHHLPASEAPVSNRVAAS